MPDLGIMLNPQLFPIYDPLGRPHEIPEPGIFDSPAVNVCINSRWANDIGGMIARLIEDDAWIGDDDERNAAVNQVLKLLDALGNPDNIGDCAMTSSNCCDENLTNYRINSEGVPQVSHDGGETWEDLPEFGSPLNPRSYFPPVTGTDEDDIRCKTANSVTKFFHNLQAQYHQALVDEVNELAVATIFEGALLLIGLVPFSLISIVGTTIALLVAEKNATDFEAEFTSDFWQSLLCHAYCDCDAAGVYINTDPRQIIDEVTADIGGYASEWLNSTLGLLSGKALTNAGAAGYDEGLSCADCDCDSCTPHVVVNRGTEVERGIDGDGHCYVIVDSEHITEDNNEETSVQWQEGDGPFGTHDTSICKAIHWSVITGSPSVTLAFGCNSESYGFSISQGACVWYMQNAASAGNTFQIKYWWVDC